ncbi:DUF2442 domain-containing protein [Duganella sp. PWIR1]|jgi:hypothetical protein
MDWDVTEVRMEGTYAFRVRFKDGVEGVVKFMPSAFRGVFARLRNPAEFGQVSAVDGVVTWPGELDLAPDAMHAQIAKNGEWILS